MDNYLGCAKIIGTTHNLKKKKISLRLVKFITRFPNLNYYTIDIYCCKIIWPFNHALIFCDMLAHAIFDTIFIQGKVLDDDVKIII